MVTHGDWASMNLVSFIAAKAIDFTDSAKIGRFS